MVFMGTESFPNENEWSSYLAERGGEDNGETALETTTCDFDVQPVYICTCTHAHADVHIHTCTRRCYFDVQPEHLQSCLERFASFFACPLFNFDSAQREVQAIESEFQQAKTEDENRFYQLLCHLMGDTHP